MHRSDARLCRQESLGRRDIRSGARLVPQQPHLRRARRIAERDTGQETVVRRRRQCVGAVVARSRVLRGDDHERWADGPRVSVDRDLTLLHRLQEPRLGLRRRPVDLVDQHHVGEHRARLEVEPALLGSPHVGADDVAGKKVDRGLDARHPAAHAGRQGPGEHRLPHAGVILDEQVTTREQRGQDHLERRLRNLDGGAQAGSQLLSHLAHTDERHRSHCVRGPHQSLPGRRTARRVVIARGRRPTHDRTIAPTGRRVFRANRHVEPQPPEIPALRLASIRVAGGLAGPMARRWQADHTLVPDGFARCSWRSSFVRFEGDAATSAPSPEQ